jgi:integration host factor subunit beta
MQTHNNDKEHSTMTKAELIEEVSKVVEMTRKDSETIVETIFDSIVNSLHKGEKIEIRGFGSFRTRQRQPRVGRNPKTGSRVEVPSKRIPYFKPSKELRDLVNQAAQAGHPPSDTDSEPTPTLADPSPSHS